MAAKSDFRRRFRRAKTTETRRKIWCEALESGLWKQGYGCLGDSDVGYCCLGVARDLGVPDAGDAPLSYQVRLDYSAARKLLGLSDGYGTYNGAGNKTDLTALNDEKKASFKRIAATIRREPRGLLVKEG
jgi:hypothetical protein